MILPSICAGIIVFCLIMAAGAHMFEIGRKRGILEERHRCEKIVRQSWESGGKLSPTARRIYASVCNERDDLISEDEFWG